MFIHPSKILFFLFLMFSIFITISANSWFIAWIGLEINLLSFIPFILKKNKYSFESALKYFLIQTIASIMILYSAILIFINLNLSPLALTLGLLMKLAAAPTHQWLPSMIDGMSWPSILLLLVAQKINPFILLIFFLEKSMFSKIILFFTLFSAIIGSIGGLLQTSIRKILAYSSISHMAWLLTSISLNNKLWFSYFILYSVILLTIIYPIHILQMNTLNQLIMNYTPNSNILILLSLLSMGGMPPFTGFLPKLLVIQELNYYSLFLPLTYLLSSTLISLFFYFRLTILTIMFLPHKNKLSSFKNMPLSISFINIMGLTIPSLLFIF
uniref:NADH-ubiquinone oxidoreductase chain 2 n=1 Tax=Bahadzia jaraguensis TaxID=1041811 RepID=K7ZTT4_BAHJA|nr:NADH dehydrogenase subunit 2 [Bahadzia jaraguensis]